MLKCWFAHTSSPQKSSKTRRTTFIFANTVVNFSRLTRTARKWLSVLSLMGNTMKLNLFLRWHATHLQECLNLGHYQIVLNRCQNLRATMDNTVDCEYLTSEIRWGNKLEAVWDLGKHAEVVRCLAHEIAHCITSEQTYPMEDRTLKREETFFDERVTETVGRICYRLYWRWLRETKPKGYKLYRFTP